MKLRIGVDGGGTKTECIAVDESGRIVARHLAPGCNPNVVGRDQAARIVTAALAELAAASRLPPSEGVLLCISGSRPFWREFAASLQGYGKVVTTDDSLPVLELATNGGPGLLLHAGTGSFVAARGEADAWEAVRYAGGLGFRFGDPGSGYDVGRRAAARGLLELQGWAEASELGDMLRKVTGLEAYDAILAWFYGDQAPNPKISGLAAAVLTLAGKGGEAARAVAVESARGLLDLAIAVAAKVFPEQPAESIRAGISGPILTHPVMAEALAARSPFPLKRVEEPAIEGVRRLCLKLR